MLSREMNPARRSITSTSRSDTPRLGPAFLRLSLDAAWNSSGPMSSGVADTFPHTVARRDHILCTKPLLSPSPNNNSLHLAAQAGPPNHILVPMPTFQSELYETSSIDLSFLTFKKRGANELGVTLGGLDNVEAGNAQLFTRESGYRYPNVVMFMQLPGYEWPFSIRLETKHEISRVQLLVRILAAIQEHFQRMDCDDDVYNENSILREPRFSESDERWRRNKNFVPEKLCMTRLIHIAGANWTPELWCRV